MVAAMKYAKYNELTEKDIVLTVFTDSMELYNSRMRETHEKYGEYSRDDAIRDSEILNQITIDNMLELDYYSKKRIHNLKYYTWIEQQEKPLDELNAQWYDAEAYWGSIHQMAPKIDELIKAFNEKTGLLK
jgi:hypothetical protein